MKLNFLTYSLAILFSASVIFPFVSQAQFDISKCNQQENELNCRKRLEDLAKEINALNGGIRTEDQNQSAIGQEINKLTGEIRKTTTEISKKNSLITNIKNDITKREQSLSDLNDRLRKEKESLEKIIRKRYELGDATLFEVLLSNQNISDFYKDAPSFSYIQDSLSDSFQIIDQLRVDIHGQKAVLEKKEEEEGVAKYSLLVEQEKIEVQKKERDQALSVSQQKEASLAELKKLREEESSKIRNKLFELRDLAGGGISFGDAYRFAKEAGDETGIRPAFILAILEQESNLGKNVGTCNRNTSERIWTQIMPGPLHRSNYEANGNSCNGAASPCSWRDDQTIFTGLMAKLGRPLIGTPLSCPIGGVGWGGAMGPSQFIPATWKSYENRIAAAVGVTTADPWNARHAIHATALYLSSLGATSQTFAAERDAACRYYSGRGCSDPNVRNAFYGDGVMNRTIRIQSNIDLIN
jgi:peptidoglycan hydrolase CwlO-like protein